MAVSAGERQRLSRQSPLSLDFGGQSVPITSDRDFDHVAADGCDCRWLSTISGDQAAAIGYELKSAESTVWMADRKHRVGDFAVAQPRKIGVAVDRAQGFRRRFVGSCAIRRNA